MCMKHKIAYVVSSLEEFEKVQVICPDSHCFVTSRLLFIQHPDESWAYYYPESSIDSIEEDLCETLTHGWYRNSIGSDLTEVDGVSIGQALSSSIQLSLTSVLREFRACRLLLERYDQVVFWNVKTVPSKVVLDCYSEEIEYVNFDLASLVNYEWPNYKTLHDWLLLRLGAVHPRVIRVIRGVQLIFGRKLLRNRHVIFSDWTNLNQDTGENPIFTNQIDLRKSALICSNGKLYDKYFRDFNNLNIEFIDAKIKKILLESIFFDFDDKLCVMLSKMIKLEIANKVVWLAKYASQIEDLIECYKPKSIQIVQENFEPFTVALCLANRFEIPVLVKVDGHALNTSDFPKLKTGDGSKIRVSKFTLTSDLLYKRALDLGFDSNQLVKQKSIFYQFYNVEDRVEIVYDAIILTWVPYVMNPQARLDSPSATLASVLQLAARLFDGHLAIKIKAESIELNYVQLVIQLSGLEDRVTILTGRLSSCIRQCRVVIGGLGSAIAESLITEIPYYVYEPIENGFTEKYHQSSIIPRDQIHTDILSLEKSICRRKNWVNKDVIVVSNHD